MAINFYRILKRAAFKNTINPLLKPASCKKQRNSVTGFTLMELLVVTFIFVVAFPAILQSFISVTLLNEMNRNYSIAMTHAQYVMEEIKGTDVNNIAVKINNGDWDWNAAAINSNGLSALKNETIGTRVSGTNLLDITVTVRCFDRLGRVNQAQLDTLIAAL